MIRSTVKRGTNENNLQSLHLYTQYTSDNEHSPHAVSRYEGEIGARIRGSIPGKTPIILHGIDSVKHVRDALTTILQELGEE